MSDSPTSKPAWGAMTSSEAQSNEKWWPNQLNLRILHQRHPDSSPLGADFDYAEAVSSIDLDELDPRRRRPHDRLEGVVAGRLGPLRRLLHPHELARRRHVPGERRPWRRRHRRPALRPPQLLAGQRQPRQGPPPAAADQAEVRQGHLVGRPLRLRRQPRPRDHGLQDLRLLVRPRRHLVARGRHLLGSRDRVARRRALLRRPRARRSARRGPDGPDLREPRGPQRRPRRAGLGS